MSIRDHNGGLAPILSMGAPEIFAWQVPPSLCTLSDTKAVPSRDFRALSAKLVQKIQPSPCKTNFFLKWASGLRKHYQNEHQGLLIVDWLRTFQWEPLKSLPEYFNPPCACSQILRLCSLKISDPYLQDWASLLIGRPRNQNFFQKWASGMKNTIKMSIRDDQWWSTSIPLTGNPWKLCLNAPTLLVHALRYCGYAQ